MAATTTSVSLFAPTNKLAVEFQISLNLVVLLTLSLVFSESVPNTEQSDIINKLFAFGEGLQAQLGTSATPGSITNTEATGKVTFRVLTEAGDLLESFDLAFDPSVPNTEQTTIFAALANFAAGVAQEAAPAVVAAPAA